MFNQTKIPSLIKAQEAGQLLVVLGVGEFKVEWHLSTDMKTMKCMYGLGHGACAKHVASTVPKHVIRPSLEQPKRLELHSENEEEALRKVAYFHLLCNQSMSVEVQLWLGGNQFCLFPLQGCCGRNF